MKKEGNSWFWDMRKMREGKGILRWGNWKYSKRMESEERFKVKKKEDRIERNMRRMRR